MLTHFCHLLELNQAPFQFGFFCHHDMVEVIATDMATPAAASILSLFLSPPFLFFQLIFKFLLTIFLFCFTC